MSGSCLKRQLQRWRNRIGLHKEKMVEERKKDLINVISQKRVIKA